MPAKGDEVADKIEGRIREAVDRMMVEIHTSIQDVRKAIEQQLDAAVQSVQADVKGFTFRGPLDEGIRELEESLGAGAPAAPLPAGPSELKQAVRAIESGKNQVEVLTSLLEQCLHYGSRAALMILKGETFTGWKAAGFSAHGGNDEQMKRFAAGREGAPQFDALLREEQVIEWDGTNLAARFGVTPSSRALLIPMVIKDKVAAAVYVDATGEDTPRFDRPSLELLVFTTGLLIDTLAIRKKIPSPSLSGETVAPVSQTATPPPQPAPPHSFTESASPPSPEQTVAIRYPKFQPRPEPALAVPPPEPEPEEPNEEQDVSGESASPAAGEPDAPSRTFQLETEPPPAKSLDAPSAGDSDSEFSTAMFPMVDPATVAPAPPLEESAPADAPPEAPATGEPSPERPSTQYVPPPGMQRGAAFGARDSDERRHDEARRFARLLVSEIKLYNESKVEQGRREKDIYERLKEDIDRSQQMYDDRVPEDVRNGTNYFYEELVRILADGNREALGL